MPASSALRSVPLLDLRPIHEPIREELLAAIARVVDSQRFILGEDVALLENELATYCRVEHAVTCGSGSDALFLALLAADVHHGDRVVTTPFTFFASAGAIVRAGAIPVFVDIDPATYNMDPEQLERAARRVPRIKAVMPVHLYGGSADLDPIVDIARRRGWKVIGDAAQSIGAEYKGQSVAAIGDINCFSFFPTKNLGGMGEGGLLTTADPGTAKRLAGLRVHGSQVRYYHDEVGINSRLDTLQAAILRVKLRHLDEWTAARQANAGIYGETLGAGTPYVSLPQPAAYQTNHVYNQFVVRSTRRDQLKEYLKANGVGSEIYYPLPLHEQICFQDLGYREGDFPVSEQAAREVLALPIYPGLSQEDLAYVAELLKAFEA
ncbi:MAG: DegT/DnrJ/EryC1/StrS family aminotransferase [Bryobacteraceae bacterium]|nr:DegT/DnrJ/EryC1/StrS family aminotransferase [Bryobacteraceae bacterium]